MPRETGGCAAPRAALRTDDDQNPGRLRCTGRAEVVDLEGRFWLRRRPIPEERGPEISSVPVISAEIMEQSVTPSPLRGERGLAQRLAALLTDR
jgi:hypothetical protein